jgi:hypothetical protein
MIRLHELCLSLAAVGFVTMLALSGGSKSRGLGWDPRESQTGFLGSSVAAPIRSLHPSTGPTLATWPGAGRSPSLVRAVWSPANLRGVRVSLQSPDYQASAGLNNCAFVSVQNGSLPGNCSTGTSTNTNAVSCSVQGANAGSATQWCSTSAANTTGLYCSANAGGNANPTVCSTAGGPAGPGNASNACSAGGQPIVNGSPQGITCSISWQAQPNGTTSKCSAAFGANALGNTCSTGSLSGNPAPAGSSAQCTALNGGGSKFTGNGFCSVGTDGAGNTCSTTQSSGTLCSTFGAAGSNGMGGANTFTCSVSSAFTQATCTAANTIVPVQPNACSAHSPASGNCSIINGTTVTGPTNGLCTPTGN